MTTTEKKRPIGCDPQLEFEAAQLLLIALKPLSPSARKRVITFVTSQIGDTEPPAPVVASPFASYISLTGFGDGSGDE